MKLIHMGYIFLLLYSYNMRKTYQTHQIPTQRYFPLGLAKSGDELENDRAAYRVAADLDPFETKAAAGAIRESMAIFMLFIVIVG